MKNEPTEADSHKLIYHPERVSEWIGKGDCFPIYVEIGLTNICNHKCIFCGLDWARGQDTLNINVLIDNLKDMKAHGIKSICYSGAGEPLLHKDFPFIIKFTKELGINVAFSTNAVLFDKETAEKTLPYTTWIRFSVDAATPETHAKIHGVLENDFQKILDNLQKAVEIKKQNNYDVTLGVQFLLLEENAHEVLKIAEICKRLGVDNLQVKPYSYNPNSFNKFEIDYEKFDDLKEKLMVFADENFKIIFRTSRGERVLKRQEYNQCHGLPFIAIINEKGNIMPCHLFYDKDELSYGNIYKNKFSEIWRSEQRKEVLRKIQEKGVDQCKKGCRLDLINSYLHKLKISDPNFHRDFI